MLEHIQRSEIEKGLLDKLPFRVVPTNLPGAYSVVAPPDDFDPQTARPADLIKYGILLRRPQENDDPALREAWAKVFSSKWLASDRIVPEMRLQKRKNGSLANKTYTDTTWAGACIRGGSWQGVVGNWTVPTVSQPPEPPGRGEWDSVSWVGIDGGNLGKKESNDVLQIGIQHTFSGYGACYCAWYEWYTENDTDNPAAPVYVLPVTIANFPVLAGDQIFASAQYIVQSFGYLYMANLSTGIHTVILLAPPPSASFKGNTVEWIMETPSGESVNSLPAFTPLVFTSAIACGTSEALGNPLNADLVNIETATKPKQILTSSSVGNYSVTVDFIG